MRLQKIKIHKKVTAYGMFSVLFVLVWNRETLFQYIKSVIWRIPLVSYGTNIYTFLLFCILTILSWSYMKKKIKFRDIIYYLLFVSFYLISIGLKISASEYLIDNMYLILVQIIPAYFVGIAIDATDDKLFRYLHVTSLLSIYLHLLSTIIIGIESINSVTDNMDLAYRILPHVCLVLYSYIEYSKPVDLISVIIGMLALIWFGSRGAFLLAVLFGAIYYVFFKRHKYRALIYVLLGAGTTVFVCFSHDIFLFARDVLLQFGIKTRIFDRIVEQSFFQSVGRTKIAQELMNAIMEKPLCGYGLAGDRDICSKVKEVYAHNIALELWTSFGVVVGSVLLLATVAVMLSAVFCEKNKDVRAIVLIYICGAALLKLFLSSSYLLEYEFFFALGICISILRARKVSPKINHA